MKINGIRELALVIKGCKNNKNKTLLETIAVEFLHLRSQFSNADDSSSFSRVQMRKNNAFDVKLNRRKN